MAESKRRKPKRPKKQATQVKVKNGVKYLRMKDETGRGVWVRFPDQSKE